MKHENKESVMKVVSLKPDGYLLKRTNKNRLLEELAQFFEAQKLKKLS